VAVTYGSKISLIMRDPELSGIVDVNLFPLLCNDFVFHVRSGRDKRDVEFPFNAGFHDVPNARVLGIRLESQTPKPSRSPE